MLPARVDSIRSPSLTKQERDEVVWANLTEPRKSTEDWSIPWRGGRPRDFDELGLATKAGADWEIALGDWIDNFVRLKNRKCLEAEPPSWMMREDRVARRLARSRRSRTPWTCTGRGLSTYGHSFRTTIQRREQRRASNSCCGRTYPTTPWLLALASAGWLRRGFRSSDVTTYRRTSQSRLRR